MITLLWIGHSRLQGLCNGADLVDFEQQAVARLLSHTLGDALGVGDSEVITHHLNARAGCEVGPCLPVILVKGVLNGHHYRMEGRREQLKNISILFERQEFSYYL